MICLQMWITLVFNCAQRRDRRNKLDLQKENTIHFLLQLTKTSYQRIYYRLQKRNVYERNDKRFLLILVIHKGTINR